MASSDALPRAHEAPLPPPPPPCVYCNLRFPTVATLRQHKSQQVQAEAVTEHYTHYYCAKCDYDFHSLSAGGMHMRQRHPAESKALDCPGCLHKYPRLGGLIQHIESDECPIIKAAAFAQRREAKLSFTKQLNKLNNESGDMGYRKMKDFSMYLGMDDDLNDDDLPLGKLSISRNNDDPGFSMTDAEKSFPPLGGKDDMPVNLKASPHRQQVPRPAPVRNTPGNPWMVDKPNFFPDAKSAEQPSAEIKAAIENARARREVVFEPHDPNDPTFSADGYWNPYSQKYKCPHQYCIKSMPTKSGFVAHLRSSVHRSKVIIRCPQCYKTFNTVAALAHHAESQSRRCHIRKTDIFKIFIDQLSVGVAAVAGRNADQTLQFATTEDARNTYGNKLMENEKGLDANRWMNKAQEGLQTKLDRRHRESTRW